MKTQYIATAPDGTVVKRSSARTYTHVVLVRDSGGWGALSWAGSFALAEKKLKSESVYWGTGLVIAPVTSL